MLEIIDWRITHGMTKTPEYRAWHSMRQRCANPNNCRYSAGAENNNSRLTENDVRLIRQMIQNGLADTAISQAFGVRPGTVWFIRTGKHWGHVQ